MEIMLEQGQHQIMSAKMQQALRVLQMPADELRQYLAEQAMENPVLEVSDTDPLTEELPEDTTEADIIWEMDYSGNRVEAKNDRRNTGTFETGTAGEESFTEMLLRQLREERRIPRDLLPLCRIIVGSLDERGYLADEVPLLAEMAGVGEERMLQALYAVQELSPAGVGARSLQECLMIQLAQTREFRADTLHLITEGLPLLAEGNLTALAKKLNLSREKAERAAEVVRALNPIPSRGYRTREEKNYVIPEARVERKGEGWNIVYSDSAIPGVGIHTEYCALLRGTEDAELRSYLKRQVTGANTIIKNVELRKKTLLQVIECLVRRQSAFLERPDGQLVPFVIAEAAEELGLHSSTVSRAVQGKYITTPRGTIALKSLFSVPSSRGSEVSSAGAKEQVRMLILAEDKAHPLSDEKLRQELEKLGLSLSRRTVTKYRESMGIPAASARRRTEKEQEHG